MLTFYANLGDDMSPLWEEITDSMLIHSAGAGSNSGLLKPNIRPDAGYVWNEELWVGPETVTGSKKVSAYRKPSAADQQGKVFKVVFSEAVLSAPYISAFDDEGLNSWDKEILAGTNNTGFFSMLKLFVSGRESANVPPVQNWTMGDLGRFGSANPNCLKGNSCFVTVPFIPQAGDDFTFCLAFAIPADANYGRENRFDPKIAVKYVHV